jgi:hypothetical protein
VANQNFKVKTGLEVGTGVTISAGIVTAISFSGNATNATYAVTAGVSTSVIGGIASITQLNVSGIASVGTAITMNASDGSIQCTTATVNGDVKISGITTYQNSISIRPLDGGNEYLSISPNGRMVLGSAIGTDAGIEIINNTTSPTAEIFTITTPNVNLYDKKIIVDYGGRLLLGGNLDSSLNNAFTVIDNSGNIKLTGYVSAGGTIGASALYVGSGTTITSDGTIITNQLNVSGVVTATTFVGNLTGTATTTTNIPNLTGDITSNGTATSIASGVIVNDDINASAAIAVSKLSASTISGVTLGNNLSTLTLNTSGTGLSGSTTYNGSGSATFTVASNATSSNTNSTIVARDASGNFSAGTITASLSGGTLTNYTETIYAFGNTGATPTFSLSNGNFITATLNANITSMTFSMTGVPSGAFSFTLFLRNDATPGRSITWPPSVRWPNGSVPTRTTTANQADVYTFFTTDGGSVWYGNLSLYNYA